MELSEIGEFGLIARIKRRFAADAQRVCLGIGDDAAILSLTPGNKVVATVDLLIEGIHFDLSLISPKMLGRKALAVNLSDIAAMGAAPLYALLSLAIPARLGLDFLDEFSAGLSECADQFAVFLVGGDTSASPSQFFINLTLLGQGERETLVTRRGASPGDDLYVTGTLGDSLLGLNLAKAKRGTSASVDETFLLGRHFNPSPRVQEGKTLAQRRLAKAMIDISDGLVSDLRHICEESRTGATIWARRVPQSPAFQSLVPAPRDHSWQWALKGGEDYELLFAAAPEKAEEIVGLGRQWQCGITRIGKVEPREKGITIWDDGNPVDPSRFMGYDHFGNPPDP